MDEFLAAVLKAQCEAEAAREETRERVLTDPVAYAVVTTFQRAIEAAWGRDRAHRADAILDGTTTILSLLGMASRGELP